MVSKSKIDLLALKRKTKLSHILDKVPKPARALPLNAPQEWQQLSLDALMPMFSWPSKRVLFSRNKIGREIFSSVGTEFDLSDPYCQTVSFDYEPLHDHNLREFYQRGNYIKTFIENGSITEEHEVICTLKQFNEYRRYLKRHYLTEVNRERALHDEYNIDRRRFGFVEKLTKKFFEMCQRREVVLEKRKKFKEDMRNEAENRKKKFANLMEKYRATICRFEEIKKRKQYEVKHKSNLKEFYARQRRFHLKQREKRRTILLKRKFVVESQLVKRRMRAVYAQATQQRNARIKASWDAKVVWQAQRQIQNNHLMAMCEENMNYNILRRNKGIAMKYEKDLQRITEKRAQIIRARYQQRTPKNIAEILFNEIQKFIRQKEKENKGKDLYLSRSSHNSVSSDLSSCREEEIKWRQEMKVIESKILSKSEPNVMSKTTSIAVRESALYQPQKLTAVGLGDFANGYRRLTMFDVNLAVSTAFHRMHKIHNYITTMAVISEAMCNLKRLSKGYVFDIPRDNAVLMCVRNAVLQIFENVIADQVQWIKSYSKQQHEIKPVSKQNQLESIKVKGSGHVQFGEIFIINSSAYEDTVAAVKSSKDRSPTPDTTIQRLAHTIVRSCETGDATELNIPNDIQNLQHLYDFQKEIIVNNLDQLCMDLSIKINHALIQRTHSGKQIPNKIELSKVNYNKMVNVAVDSILTLPEKDIAYADRLLCVRDFLTEMVLKKSKK